MPLLRPAVGQGWFFQMRSLKEEKSSNKTCFILESNLKENCQSRDVKFGCFLFKASRCAMTEDN